MTISNEEQKNVRSRLLSEEVKKMTKELEGLRDHILVEGDWSFEEQEQAYIFKRPFIDKVKKSPFCEVKVAKTDIHPQYKEVFHQPNNNPIRLAVFGKVISGVSSQSQIVRLLPIAIY
jgi:hypothetical protein